LGGHGNKGVEVVAGLLMRVRFLEGVQARGLGSRELWCDDGGVALDLLVHLVRLGHLVASRLHYSN